MPQELYLSEQVINVPASAGDYANRTRAGERVQSPVWFRLRRVRTDTYATQDSGLSSGSISTVTIHIRVCKGLGGSKVKTVLRTGGADYLSSQINLNSTEYSDHSTTYSTNPATSAAWTWAEIDAMEIGVTSRKAARCTQIYADVQYTGGGGGGGGASYTYTVQWQESP